MLSRQQMPPDARKYEKSEASQEKWLAAAGDEAGG